MRQRKKSHPGDGSSGFSARSLHLAAAIEDDDVIVGENPQRGTLDTEGGRVFMVGVTGLRNRTAEWTGFSGLRALSLRQKRRLCPDSSEFALLPSSAFDQVDGAAHTFSADYFQALLVRIVAMQVLSAAEMQACDRATTERFGIPSIQLMRAASSAVAAFARQQFPHARRVTVLCGKGNNGGDGMMAARLLADAGLEVTTLLLGAAENLTGDAAVAWSELSNLKNPKRGQIHVVTNAKALAMHNDALNADLIVDAVLGTGFKPPLKGLALEALEWLLRSRPIRADSRYRLALRLAGR